MDQVIQPIGEKPLMVRRGAKFTRIVVNQAQAADGEKYEVMFIGTGVCVCSVLYQHTVTSIGLYVSAFKYSMFLCLHEKRKARC